MRLWGRCSLSVSWSSGPTNTTAPALVGSKRRYAGARRDKRLGARVPFALSAPLLLERELQDVPVVCCFEVLASRQDPELHSSHEVHLTRVDEYRERVALHGAHEGGLVAGDAG